MWVFFRYYKHLKIVYFGTTVTEQLVRAEPFVFSFSTLACTDTAHVVLVSTVFIILEMAV